MENFDLLNSVIFPYANFIIFAILATLLLRKPIMNGLATKRQNHLDLVARSTKIRDEAEQKSRELQDKLKGLDAELAAIRAESKAQAEDEAQKIIADAQKLAEHLKREARRIVDAEVAAAKKDVQQEVLKQVRIKTAEEIQRTLDDSRQHKVIQQGLSQLSAVKEVQG